MKAGVVDGVCGAHAQGVGVKAAPLRIAAIEDRHVAADTARAFKEAAGRGIGLHRRDDFDEGKPERKQRVLQSVAAHLRVLIGELDAEDRPHVGDRPRQIRRHQTNLPQAAIVGHFRAPVSVP